MTVLDVVQSSGGSVAIYRIRGLIGDHWVASYQSGDVVATGIGSTAHLAHTDLLAKLAEQDLQALGKGNL